MSDAMRADRRSRPTPLPSIPDQESSAPLPAPLTSFVGREHEVAVVAALLRQNEVRLLTLAGPGGVGKTRLALQAAAALHDVFADGVGFIPLVPVRDPRLVLPTIAHAFGLQELGRRPLLDRLLAALRPRHMLLLLDNFEQVLDAAPQVAMLLSGCPDLKLLVTSRSVLHISGEHDLAVPPLTLPPSEAPPSLDAVAPATAVQLFVTRASAARPDFALTEANAAAVAAIVRRLDGLPLAIELAAARVAHLPVPTMLRRLEQRLPLLTGGPRDAPLRLQTMRDAIAWSYDLLSPAEQALFRRLAVFVGGCTLEAAAGVAGELDQPEWAILEGIATLVDHSLLQTAEGAGDEPRYQMLETIRDYGLEQLAASGESEETRRRHAAYVLALAQAGAAALESAEQGDWLARLEAEQGNLRAALTWLRDRHEGESGLRLAVALGSFWHIRSANAEARAWLETFLAEGTPASTDVDRGAALRWAGEFAGLLGDSAAAEARLTESLTLARQEGDTRSLAASLRAIGSAALLHGDAAGGRAAFAEAAALARELGDLRQTSFLLAFLAYAAGVQGDLTRGETLAAESESLVRSLGDTCSFEASLAVLVNGLLALMRGDYDRAENRLEAALALSRPLAAKANISVALGGLAEIALAKGAVEVAARHAREGLIVGSEGDFPSGMIFNLLELARIARRGRALVAARLVGAVDAFGDAIAALPRTSIAAYEADVARLRTALGEASLAAARTAGRALPLEEAIAEALALPIAPAPPTAAAAAPAAPGLSPRELDVLRLVAAGHSNRQIAEALYISVPTVKRHLTTILAKLDLPSRSAAAAHAHTHGLI